VIYGLKQSLWAWFDMFSRIISKVGLQKCYSERSILIHRTSSGTMIHVVFVDAILLTEVMLVL